MSRKRTLLLIMVTALTVFMTAALSVSAESVKNATGYINSSTGVNVRTSASVTAKKVTVIDDNQKVTILQEVFTKKSSTASKDKWYKITYNGKTGYVRSDLIDGIKYSEVTGKTNTTVNYRVGPGTSMKKKGTLSKGTSVKVICKAKPYGSSVLWYKVKIGSGCYYMSSKRIDLVDSTPKVTASTATSTGSSKSTSSGTSAQSSSSSSGESSAYSDVGFEKYLKLQGFPESYKVKLRALHKDHPKWVFIGKKTGLDFNTVVDKECGDGVSLINYAYPLSYRDTGANSYKGVTGTVYKSASKSSGKVATAKSGQAMTVLDEKFTGNSSSDSYRWTHVKLADGKSGYIQGALTSQSYSRSYKGTLTDDVNIRQGAGTGMSYIKTLDKGTKVDIVLKATASNGTIWYKIKNGGGYAYIVSSYVTVDPVKNSSGGTTTPSLKDLSGTGKMVLSGSFIPKDGSTWFNADRQVVEYCMDPRNFLNKDRIYMFESLTYQKYQSKSAVKKILDGTALSRASYKPDWFMSAGKKYKISPISLAARAREEVGGGSPACSGYKINGRTYYNPFNIGATPNGNPLKNGMNYAKKMGWNTKQKAINGAAKMLSGGYLSNRQHTLYYQRFNVANGLAKVATHQYMTNIMAPYSEAMTTKISYTAIGLTREQLVFEIPIYNNMPESTKLPN